jgi:hypothetical protein
MNANESGRTIALTPPIIREANDGGLGYDDVIANPWRRLTAQAGPWGKLFEGDVIDILWGESLQPIARHIYRKEDDRVPLIYVSVDKIHEAGEGRMQIAAQLTDIDTGDIHRSDTAEVLVKFSVPGDVDPESATPYLNENLTHPTISPSAIPDDFSGVEVIIPPYKHMAAGDSVSVRWQGVAVSRPALASTEVGHPVRIAIDRDTAMSSAGQDVIVRYQVHDTVGNWSRWSPAAVVSVPPAEGSSPPSPWVVGTVGDNGSSLDVKEIGLSDVVVRVENHPMAVGTMASAVWDGVTATGKALSYTSSPQKVQRLGQTLDFRIPNARVVELAGGDASASYVFTEGGAVSRSLRRKISILGNAPALLPPMLREAQGNAVNPSDIDGRAHVDVAAWPGLRDDDRCYLEWVGQRKDGQPTFFNAALTGANVGPDNRLIFEVPAEEVVRLAGGKLRVRYAVAVHTQVRSEHGLRSEPLVHISSPWLELTVGAQATPLSIDSSPAVLASPIVRLEKRVTIPPAGAFVARVASGGVPPYRYSASSGAVEVDAATGRVVSLRNGNAIVTATDAKGATVSYPVKVSNVLHLTDLVVQTTYALGNGQARKRGGRQPSLAEWDAMRAAYGGAPDVRADAAWSSHQIDKFDNYVVYPNTGAREARKAFGLGNPLGVAWVWCVTAPNA